MRHVIYVSLLVAFGTSRAFATPFEPATIPDQAAAIGHLDVDALRRTQVFSALDGQKAVDAAVDHAPADLRPLVRSIAAHGVLQPLLVRGRSGRLDVIAGARRLSAEA